MIKKKEFVQFSDILEIKDNHVSPLLQMGVFKKASGKAKQNRRYRLFSVVEHVGNYAHKGHYVCYSLDSLNQWVKFDDTRVSEVQYQFIVNNVQAYMLYYELIQEEE